MGYTMNEIPIIHNKIQWILSRYEPRRIYSLVRLLGAKNITVIVFRNSKMIPISKYRSMNSFSDDDADEETVKALKFYLKKNPEIEFVELYKK